MAVSPRREEVAEVFPARHLWTVEEYELMGEAGIFHEDDRVELIEGEIYEMPPIGPGHQGDVDRLTDLLTGLLRGRAIVRIQGPVVLGPHSEPQPDLLLLRYRDDYYSKRHPGPDDVLLAVEVAQTTQRFDREVKLPLYARMGIPEYWLVDLRARVVEVYTEPGDDGYASSRKAEGADVLPLVAFPDARVTAEDVLGP